MLLSKHIIIILSYSEQNYWKDQYCKSEAQGQNNGNQCLNCCHLGLKTEQDPVGVHVVQRAVETVSARLEFTHFVTMNLAELTWCEITPEWKT